MWRAEFADDAESMHLFDNEAQARCILGEHPGEVYPVQVRRYSQVADALKDELAECTEALTNAFRAMCSGLRKSELGINPQQLIERAEAAIECWRNDTGDHDA